MGQRRPGTEEGALGLANLIMIYSFNASNCLPKLVKYEPSYAEVTIWKKYTPFLLIPYKQFKGKIVMTM